MLARRSFKADGPAQQLALTGWLRLTASAQSGGEFTSLVDVLNSNPATQADTDRRAAIGAAANGLPTLVFDGTDVYPWPFSATINNMTTKLGFWLWYKPVSVTGIQVILNGTVASGGPTTLSKFALYAQNATLKMEWYITNTTGRVFTTGNVLTAGAWIAIYVQYDSSRGGDANALLYLDGVLTSTTPANIGAGGTLTVLQQPGGNIILGGVENSDTPSSPLANGAQIGPNIFSFGDNLTAAQIALFLLFEAPT